MRVSYLLLAAILTWIYNYLLIKQLNTPKSNRKKRERERELILINLFTLMLIKIEIIIIIVIVQIKINLFFMPSSQHWFNYKFYCFNQ